MSEASSMPVQYELKQVVGKGSYGVVYRAVNKRTRTTVAIKEVAYEGDDELHEVMAEIDLLKNLDHVHIVKYHGFIQKPASLYIILEYAAHGSLKGLMAQRLPRRCLEEQETQRYIAQTLAGLAYLHAQGVIHRDIKAANLLLDAHDVVKLADFGVSTLAGSAATTLAGSLNWMAPEIITSRGASPRSDIWSLGATVVELLTGHPPFHNLVDINICYAIEHDTYYPPHTLSAECQRFLRCCFQRAAHKRPSASQLLRHQWLREATPVVPDTPSHGADRLARFQEDESERDRDWDGDFVRSASADEFDGEDELDGLTNYVAERAPNSDVFTSSPVKALHSHSRSATSSPVRLPRSASPTKQRGGNPGLQLAGSQPLEDLQPLFADCSTSELAETVLRLLKSGADPRPVIAILHHDARHNNDKVRQRLRRYGGMALVMRSPQVVTSCFMGETQTPELFAAGIMDSECLQLYARDRPRTYLELVHRYLAATSSGWWHDWCAQNLDTGVLFRELHRDKRAQAVLVKLAGADSGPDREHRHWVLHTLLPALVVRHSAGSFAKGASATGGSGTACLYVLLKALALALDVSAQDTEDLAPGGTRSSSPARQADTSLDDASISALALPPSCEQWLLALARCRVLTGTGAVANVHVWKYYTRVCYNAAHLDAGFLSRLYATPQLFALLGSLLDEPARKHVLPPLKQWQLLLLELAQTHRPLAQPQGDTVDEFFAAQVRLAQDPQLCPLALETVLSVLQNVQGPFYSERARLAALLRDSRCLEAGFYAADPEQVNVSTFVNRYCRLAAQQPFAGFSRSLLLHGEFTKRLRLLFRMYRASLLIQLDLLKLVKALFAGCGRELQPLLQQVNAFLADNWAGNSAKQVGRDSVLLVQLCADIAGLRLGEGR
ncbi:serine/threonine protein kinase [Maudiozyma humilis]|uniref:non-specific serine/threonine protein kinase n=1 Tax=Maudiozyma humilis TaxID=51915 RepID=A0AAV5S5K9_MAUHU|nr:serine/threonine protein kinase [Kazachstania humilis]